jgi:hypothetical protein
LFCDRETLVEPAGAIRLAQKREVRLSVNIGSIGSAPRGVVGFIFEGFPLLACELAAFRWSHPNLGPGNWITEWIDNFHCVLIKRGKSDHKGATWQNGHAGLGNPALVPMVPSCRNGEPSSVFYRKVEFAGRQTARMLDRTDAIQPRAHPHFLLVHRVADIDPDLA